MTWAAPFGRSLEASVDPNDKAWKQFSEMVKQQSRLFDDICQGVHRDAERAWPGARALAEEVERTTSLFKTFKPNFGAIADTCSKLAWPAVDFDRGATAAFQAFKNSIEEQGALFDRLGLKPENLGDLQREAVTPARPWQGVPSFVPRPAREPIGPDFSAVQRSQGRIHLTLATLCIEQKKWAEAEVHARSAADWLEDSAEPFIALGIALNAQGQHQGAVEAFGEAEKRDPACLSTRPDIRAVYEASAQGRRWDGGAVVADLES